MREEVREKIKEILKKLAIEPNYLSIPNIEWAFKEIIQLIESEIENARKIDMEKVIKLIRETNEQIENDSKIYDELFSIYIKGDS